MRVLFPSELCCWRREGGATLFELIIFIVIVSVALLALVRAIGTGVLHSYDPVVRVKAIEQGQALLDEILSRKFADDTPTGGVPACGSASDPDGCAAIGTGGGYNDVGDYDGYSDTSDPRFTVTVSVAEAGGDLGLAADNARLVTVSVAAGSETIRLSAYKVNF